MRSIIVFFILILSIANAAATDSDKGWKAYESGDYATALHEFQPLADQGNVLAQAFLGLMYFAGQGVPQDFIKAHMWLNLAAATDPSAAESRDIVASNMTPAQLSEAQRLATAKAEQIRK